MHLCWLPIGQKAYRLYDLYTHQFFSSRDVIFHESIFPSLRIEKSLDSTFPQLEILDYIDNLSPPATHPVPPASETIIPSPNFLLSSTSSLYSSISSPAPPLRKSDRVRQPFVLLRDFHCGQISTTPSTATSSQSFSTKSGTQYPLSKYISYDSLSSTHKHFVNTISSVLEPTSYAQAVLDPKWKEAMQHELDALNSQKTWSLVPLPAGHRPIGSKWVYRIKYNSNGTIERYKARLVAKGFSQ